MISDPGPTPTRQRPESHGDPGSSASTQPQQARRPRTWWQAAGYLTRRVIMAELHSYQSIWRLIARRPRLPVNAAGFAYHQPVMPMVVVLIVVSAVEVAIVDVIVHQWPPVRVPLLVLGVWGVVWMLGLLSGLLTRPHAVGPAGIRVRYGPEVDVPLSWADIRSVELAKSMRADKAPDITGDDTGGVTYHQRISDMTNLLIRLESPTRIRLPRGTETVTAIALYADDPHAFLDRVRQEAGRPVELA